MIGLVCLFLTIIYIGAIVVRKKIVSTFSNVLNINNTGTNKDAKDDKYMRRQIRQGMMDLGLDMFSIFRSGNKGDSPDSATSEGGPDFAANDMESRPPVHTASGETDEEYYAAQKRRWDRQAAQMAEEGVVQESWDEVDARKMREQDERERNKRLGYTSKRSFLPEWMRPRDKEAEDFENEETQQSEIPPIAAEDNKESEDNTGGNVPLASQKAENGAGVKENTSEAQKASPSSFFTEKENTEAGNNNIRPEGITDQSEVEPVSKNMEAQRPSGGQPQEQPVKQPARINTQDTEAEEPAAPDWTANESEPVNRESIPKKKTKPSPEPEKEEPVKIKKPDPDKGMESEKTEGEENIVTESEKPTGEEV